MNKQLHRLLIILIFISVSTSAYLLSTPSHNKNTSPPATNTTSSTPKLNTTEDLTPAILENNDNTPHKIIEKKPEIKTTETTKVPDSKPPATTDITPPELQTEETVPITFIIEGAEYATKVKPNSTAYEAMNALREANKISFSTKSFSGLGYFIEEINGVKNSPRTGFYWTYYINNQEAKVGISTYIIKPNDIITWKFENK
jgi:hypothetical protein